MYLHEDKETFKEIIEQVSDDTGRTAIVIEKDYYVTMILRLLSQKLSNVVFKGGTSLSKGFKAINRFSEDIDITFDEHIGEARRKKLKHVVLKGISEELCMPISNWNDTESDKDYNTYLFTYQSVWKIEGDRMLPSVKLETALGSYAFPTKIVPSEYDIDPDLGGSLVPNFILQPLVENSLLHGLKNKGYRGEVVITAKKEGNAIEILIRDSGSGFTDGRKDIIDEMLLHYDKKQAKLEGNSIGILNVQKRIKLLCGPKYGLSYMENETGGVTARLLLPHEEDAK